MRPKVNRRPSLFGLDERINPGAVTTTLDFDPRTYDETDISTYKPGYLRFEVIKAFEAGNGTVTFDSAVDLGGGVHFGDPITSANTIDLKYGQIGNILPRQTGSTVSFEIVPFTNVKILAPKYTDSTKDYVNIQWDSSIFPLFGDPNAGADWSVVKITSQEKSPDGRFPSYVDMTLGGLKLTNGRASDGAGINATGFINLNIDHCLITGNSADAVSGTNAPSTSGGGIFTQGAAVPRLYPGGGWSVVTEGKQIALRSFSAVKHVTGLISSPGRGAKNKGWVNRTFKPRTGFHEPPESVSWTFICYGLRHSECRKGSAHPNGLHYWDVKYTQLPG